MKFSAICLRRRVPWPSVDIQVKFYRYRLRGTPPSGELNRKGVAEYSDLDLLTAISQKWCKIGGKLLSITNSFRLVPKSATLNDLERCNSPNGTVISPNSVDFGADYVKEVEDTPILSAAEM